MLTVYYTVYCIYFAFLYLGLTVCNYNNDIYIYIQLIALRGATNNFPCA